MNRAFIAKPKAVHELLGELKLYRLDKWEPVYIDPRTEVKWVGYRLDDNPGDQPPNILRLHDLPLVVVCENAAYTSFDDEAAAAGLYIITSMRSDAAFESLLSTLEAAAFNAPTERIYRNVLISLAWSELNKPFNFRTVVGKNIQQVESDFLYYKELSKRAELLIERSVEHLGYEMRKTPDVFKD